MVAVYPQSEVKRFIRKISSCNTMKLFVEFHLPDYQAQLDRLGNGLYPLHSLKELCARMFDGPFGSNRTVDMYQESGVPYIRVKDVLPEGINLTELVYISEEKHQEIMRSRVVPGNVLITIAGRLGTAAVFPDSLEEGNITGHIVGIEPHQNINPFYLAAFINSRFGQLQANCWGHRTTRPELNLFELGQMLVPVPSLSVQNRIVQIIQNAYKMQQERMTKSVLLLKGLNEYVLKVLGINLGEPHGHRATVKPISSMNTGRLDFEAVVTMEDIDFHNIIPVSLGNIVTQVNERVTPSEECPDQEINYIGLENIASGTGELVDFTPVPGSAILSSSPIFSEGDILFGRMRPYLNKVWLADFNGICSGEIIVLRPRKEFIDSSFLHALLLSQITLYQVVPLQSGTSLPRVSASDVLNIKLPISLDLEQQVEIGKEVVRQQEKARQLRTDARRIIAEAETLIDQIILGEEIVV
jgi:type I restriction enzyme S subunit